MGKIFYAISYPESLYLLCYMKNNVDIISFIIVVHERDTWVWAAFKLWCDSHQDFAKNSRIHTAEWDSFTVLSENVLTRIFEKCLNSDQNIEELD